MSLSIGVVNNQTSRPHSIQEVSYLAAEAKRHAKQSTSNISYISSQHNKTHLDHSSAASSSSPLLFSPPFSFATGSHAFHDLLPFAEENILAEYEVNWVDLWVASLRSEAITPDNLICDML